MTEPGLSPLAVTPPSAGQALRCRCARPCQLAAEEGVRCLKCGRPPAIRLTSRGWHSSLAPIDCGQPDDPSVEDECGH